MEERNEGEVEGIEDGRKYKGKTERNESSKDRSMGGERGRKVVFVAAGGLTF